MGRLLTFDELRTVKGIPYSYSHLWKLEHAGNFPRRVRLSYKMVRWDEEEIDRYINTKKAARPAPPSSEPLPPPRPFPRIKRHA